MAFNGKKSRIHFFMKKVDCEAQTQCENIHYDKDFVKPAKIRFPKKSSRKKLFQQKPPDLSQITIQNSLFDRFSRKRASEIFESMNLFKQPSKKNMSPVSKLAVLPFSRYKVTKFTKEREIMETLRESSMNENAVRRSTCLNTMNLIPNAYKNRSGLGFTSERVSEDEIQDQIKTSVEKNDAKIFGIDKLVKARIEHIFGKIRPKFDIDLLIKLEQKKKPKKKHSKKKRGLEVNSEETKRLAALKKKLSTFDQKRFASEHAKLNSDLYNYRIDEMREDMIENDLGSNYSGLLNYYAGHRENARKYISFQDESPMLDFDPYFKHEQSVYKKASELIEKLKEYESDDSPRMNNDYFPEKYHLDKPTIAPKLPILFPKMKANLTTNTSKNFATKTDETVMFSNQNDSKFTTISNLIDDCHEEHKSHRAIIRELRGEKRGIVGKLKNLTIKLGVLNEDDQQLKKSMR